MLGWSNINFSASPRFDMPWEKCVLLWYRLLILGWSQVKRHKAFYKRSLCLSFWRLFLRGVKVLFWYECNGTLLSARWRKNLLFICFCGLSTRRENRCSSVFSCRFSLFLRHAKIGGGNKIPSKSVGTKGNRQHLFLEVCCLPLFWLCLVTCNTPQEWYKSMIAIL